MKGQFTPLSTFHWEKFSIPATEELREGLNRTTESIDFQSVESYIWAKAALAAGQKELAQKVFRVRWGAHVIHRLINEELKWTREQQREWKLKAGPLILKEAFEAKAKVSIAFRLALINSKGSTIGYASADPVLGIGFPLEAHPDKLFSPAKWKLNLVGESLCAVRDGLGTIDMAL